MKTVIQRYKKFIFIFTMINLIALIVNVFDIETEYHSSKPYVKSDGNDFRIHFFKHWDTPSESEVWPFVKFIENSDIPDGSTYTVFNGLFYQYDMSEFVLYMLLLVGFLFYKVTFAKTKKGIEPKSNTP